MKTEKVLIELVGTHTFVLKTDDNPFVCVIQVWKRSGAWFYKFMPKYVYPGKEGPSGAPLGLRGANGGGQKMARSSTVSRTYTWAHSKGQSVTPHVHCNAVIPYLE